MGTGKGKSRIGSNRRSQLVWVRLAAWLAGAAMLAGSGCVYMLVNRDDQLLYTGRYAQAEKEIIARVPDISQAKSVDLVKLCQIYFAQKKYHRLFACLDELEKNIAHGDKTIKSWDFWHGCVTGSDESEYFPSDATLLPHLFRAEAYIELGQYRQALASARKAQDLLPTIKWSYCDFGSWDRRLRIRILGVRALAYALNHDTEQAATLVAELEQEGAGFVGRVMVQREKFVALARVYMAMKQYDKVLQSKSGLDDALAAAGNFVAGATLVGEDMLGFVRLPRDFMLAKALLETGEINEAKVRYDELLANPRTSSMGEIYWASLFDRGRIAARNGNLGTAIEYYRRAIRVIEAQRSTIHTEASKIGFVGDKQAVYHQMVAALFQVGRYSEAFDYAERSKSRALVDLLAANDKFAPKGGPMKPKVVLARLREAEAEAAALGAAAAPADQPETSGTRAIQVLAALRSKAPELASLVSVTTPPAAAIQRRLGIEQTLVEYYYVNEDLYVFVLNRNRLWARHLQAKIMAAEAERLRRALQRPTTTDYLAPAQALYRLLIAPVESLLVSKRLVIVPHGLLHYLPFAALHDGRQFLVERFSISYLPSASVIEFLGGRTAGEPQGTLILANPDLGDPAYDLKFAEVEARAVARVLPQPRVLSRGQATETYFKNFGSRYGYLHFATHGTFRSEAPEQSGILLAPDRENDGLLNVYELYGLSLNADLVTLSACETGLGKLNPGDDVVGLTRGFLYAGCRSIVASLWQVDDRATAVLMAEFYADLQRRDKSDALRMAQIKVKEVFPHPYYWAAFKLTGIAGQL